VAPRSRLFARRRELGLSETHVAHRCKVHPETYGRWEAGTQNPRIYQHRALADVLKVPLTLDDVTDEEPHPLDWYLALDGEPSEAETPQDAGTVAPVDKREFLGGAVATVAGAALAPLEAFTSPGDVPPELAAYFADQLEGHYGADARLGARPLLRTVTSEYAVIRQATDAARSDQSDSLTRVAAGYTAFAGWLWQDMADLHQSWQWRSETLQLAHRVKDPDLIAIALASLAELHVDAGDRRGGLDFAEGALATGGMSPVGRCYALRYAADAQSLAGDRTSVDRRTTR
jgi:transcriptional regulator with XRE-family HTH domain